MHRCIHRERSLVSTETEFEAMHPQAKQHKERWQPSKWGESFSVSPIRASVVHSSRMETMTFSHVSCPLDLCCGNSREPEHSPMDFIFFFFYFIEIKITLFSPFPFLNPPIYFRCSLSHVRPLFSVITCIYVHVYTYISSYI